MDTLATAFSEQIKKAMSIAKISTVITEDNVYQEGDKNIIPLLDGMIDYLALPGSGIDGLENLEELLAKAESGKACLLLVEHYSNLDLTILCTLVGKAGGRGKEIADAILAIAGMKLNEDNPIVAAFASAYTRIIIHPSRSLQHLDPKNEKDRAEIARSTAINHAAMKALIWHKYKGNLVLVFPSGTRYRRWEPETKRGVREIDSYIRSFDYMCFVALNGEILTVQKTDMMNDIVNKDVVRVTAGPVVSCNEFRENARAAAADEDKKQAVADAIMAELEKMHIAAEETRLKMIEERK